MSDRQARLEGALLTLRRELEARHGWTHLELTVVPRPEIRQLRLEGEVMVDRLIPQVRAVLEREADGWTVDTTGLRVMTGSSWHALPEPLAHLLAAHPARDTRRPLATELCPEDGPVERLGRAEGATAVRGRDGTVGWLETPLGPPAPPSPLRAPRPEGPTALVDAARTWLNVPYRLGGVTREGIDCSSLVQRITGHTLAIVVPRHSSDQLQIAPHEGVGHQPGDLVFVWSDREALCHVGVGSGTSVIHASRSRSRVVNDPLTDFLAGARRVMHVPFTALLDFGHRMAGETSLSAAGFVLGRAHHLPR